MGRLTEGTGSGSSQGELRPGESRTLTIREWKDGKIGDVIDAVELRRTDRPYAYDLADAYNRRNTVEGKSWFVDHSGNLRFGDTPDGERATAKQLVRRREAERDRWLRNYYEHQAPRDQAA